MKTRNIGFGLVFAFLLLFSDTNAFALIATDQIEDGAVTDVKISGKVSRSKIQQYGKIAVVAQTGGDYTDPLAAMAGLATWCGTPSPSNRCLLKIMPGLYDISDNGLLMQQYVDIEGSGENTTRIKGSARSVVAGAANAELRFITIESYGSTYGQISTLSLGDGATKITNVTLINGPLWPVMWIVDNAQPILHEVTIISSGGDGVVVSGAASPVLDSVRIVLAGTGLYPTAGVHAYNFTNGSAGPSVTMTNVVIDVSSPQGEGVNISNVSGFPGGTVDMTNVKITSAAYYGIDMTNAGKVRVRDSAVKSALNTIIIRDGSTAQVAHSQLDGQSATGGSIKCIGVYDGNLDPVSCQ